MKSRHSEPTRVGKAIAKASAGVSAGAVAGVGANASAVVGAGSGTSSGAGVGASVSAGAGAIVTPPHRLAALSFSLLTTLSPVTRAVVAPRMCTAQVNPAISGGLQALGNPLEK